ncbi:AMP-binding protein [Planctomycetaceae bacterium SCGC AG-212-D15]|nr:AMP-binding protein [Planctomycetaceae bacterium SCGC AG-212-D15]
MSSPSPWIDGFTFAEVLDQTTARHPERDAVVFPQLGYRRTYSEFRAEVREIARGLMAFHVERGESVGIWATNWPQWIIAQFAVGQIGAVLVNINPAYRSHELGYVLKQADVATLLLTDRFKTSDYFALVAEASPELDTCAPADLHSPAFPKLRRVISLKEAKRGGMLSWNDLRAAARVVSETALDSRQGRVQPGDVANVQYTSGTTGFPKGAMLTHRNLLMNAYHVGACMRFGDAERLCLPVPLYHCFGCVMGTLACVVHGATMVVASECFDPLATLEAIHAERCTAVYGVPTMFIAELNHPRFGEFDLTSLRTGVMAGSPCPLEVMRQVVERMGAKEITIAYGLTEASPIITQTTPDDDMEKRIGTVGQAIPGAEVRIVAPGTMTDVPDGEAGELIVRSHGVMKGYYNKPAETTAVLSPDGWLRTGDLALRTPDGYYRITGRSKDMIIRGGENIYPREIEEYLYTHPAIADVQVVGLPDEKMGEEVCAWVRVKPGASLTEEQVRDFCRGKIAHFKVPRYVVVVDEFPTTVTGKVQKFKLRDMGAERFGLKRASSIPPVDESTKGA